MMIHFSDHASQKNNYYNFVKFIRQQLLAICRQYCRDRQNKTQDAKYISRSLSTQKPCLHTFSTRNCYKKTVKRTEKEKIYTNF